ncbi:MAG: AraC family transcriptional regulator [Gemmatimonadota bacterium]
MEYLPAGAFYGETRTTTHTGQVIVTDVDYPSGAPGAGWHYHEHAFFWLILDGHASEVTRRGTIDCPRGTLLYQCAEEPHRNPGSSARLRSVFVEVKDSWFATVRHLGEVLRNVKEIRDPRVRMLFHQIHRESVERLPHSELVVDGLLARVVDALAASANSPRASSSLTRRLADLLRDSTDTLTLTGVATELNVHPVYLSRYFARQFGCGFREYLRLARVEKALTLMHDPSLSLTDIAFAAGFADQSHFARCFRDAHGQTPSHYRRAFG